MPWNVEHREGLWRVVNGTRVWGANKNCTYMEAVFVANALNELELVAVKPNA